jgi:hypothetical protein
VRFDQDHVPETTAFAFQQRGKPRVVGLVVARLACLDLGRIGRGRMDRLALKHPLGHEPGLETTWV